nr:hypothetical protein [Paramuribaculum intestinale]
MECINFLSTDNLIVRTITFTSVKSFDQSGKWSFQIHEQWLDSTLRTHSADSRSSHSFTHRGIHHYLLSFSDKRS